ncbi:MAG: DUF3565 domain-containing protein [Alcanivorax sp.]|nr:DUF3565 domain-containing protein [Alcanivorax sp.]
MAKQTFTVTVSGFRQDDKGDWVMLLSCGHRQHVRHQPPFINRPWVTTPGGRNARLGLTLECIQCLRGDPIPADGCDG